MKNFSLFLYFGCCFFVPLQKILLSMEEKVKFYEQQFPADVTMIVTPVRIEDVGGTRFFEGEALWDTGSQRTVIAECVAKTLKLDTLPFGRMDTPAGETNVQMGAVLVFPGNVKRFVPVITGVMGGAYRKHDCIIGMDVIRRGDLTLRHDGEMLVFRFDFGDNFKQRR